MQSEWQAVLSEAAPLAEVVIIGSGKDSDLQLSLADGRRFEIGTSNVTVSAEGPMTVEFEQVDDISVQIRYSGTGLQVRSARIKYDSPDWQEEFRSDVRTWLSERDEGGEYRRDLSYVVDAEIELA